MPSRANQGQSSRTRKIQAEATQDQEARQEPKQAEPQACRNPEELELDPEPIRKRPIPDPEMTKKLEVKCPTCQKKTPWQDNPFRPFCSERCRLIDQGKWADGSYNLPSEDAPSAEDEPRRPEDYH